MTDRQELAAKVKGLIVRRLKLEIDPASIQDDAPLFGEGLGLDSIDALELVLGLEQEFGIKVQDEEVGVKAFASVNALCDFIEQKKRGAWGSPMLYAEAIAQAALLLEGRDPEIGRQGFLAGIDGFQSLRPAEAGETLDVSVELAARFGGIVKFQGEIRSGGEVLARGTVLVKKGEERAPGT